MAALIELSGLLLVCRGLEAFGVSVFAARHGVRLCGRPPTPWLRAPMQELFIAWPSG